MCKERAQRFCEWLRRHLQLPVVQGHDVDVCCITQREARLALERRSGVCISRAVCYHVPVGFNFVPTPAVRSDRTRPPLRVPDPNMWSIALPDFLRVATLLLM